MTSPSPLAQAVAVHGRGLVALRGVLEQSASDAVDLYQPWRRVPKGSALSAMTRDRFLELVGECEELAGSGVTVRSCGEDWVRVWLPHLGWMVPLRTRPKILHIGDPGLFPEDLFGPPLGLPVLFWRWDHAQRQLASFSMARVTELVRWPLDCTALENIEITADLITSSSLHPVPPPGAGNDDDDLPGLVGRWSHDEALSEEQSTDELDKDTRDDDIDPAVGEDDN